MGNRRKLRINGKRNNSLRQKKFSMRGLANSLNQPSDRSHIPTHDEIFSSMPEGVRDSLSNPDMLVTSMRAEAARSGEIITDEAFEKMGLKLQMPEDEVVVIKEVPAKVDGVIVGTAYLHDDGSVAIKYNADAPKEALDKIRATADEVGYSLETGD